jgi:hypothetical protein
MQWILLEDKERYPARIVKILSRTVGFIAKILNQGIAEVDFHWKVDLSWNR